MGDFAERSGIISSKTDWGCWWQTVSEVTVEVNVEPGTRGKDISVTIKPSCIECSVRGKIIFKGNLRSKVRADESVWTLEDGKLLRIVLVKAEDFKNVEKVWESLLDGKYVATPAEFWEMQKKLDLEKFQLENPGFDFSGAKLDKKYDNIPDSIVKQLGSIDRDAQEFL